MEYIRFYVHALILLLLSTGACLLFIKLGNIVIEYQNSAAFQMAMWFYLLSVVQYLFWPWPSYPKKDKRGIIKQNTDGTFDTQYPNGDKEIQ